MKKSTNHKKWIVITILLVLYVIGLGLNISLNSSQYFSQENACVNHCWQAIICLIISFVIGFYFIFYTKRIVELLTKVFIAKLETDQIRLLSIRFMGILLVIFAPIGAWNSCLCTTIVNTLIESLKHLG